MDKLKPKVIHVFPYTPRRGGGPAGYGLNLTQALALTGSMDLLSIISPSRTLNTEGAHVNQSTRFKLLKRFPPWLTGILVTARTTSILKNAFHYFGFTSEQLTEIKASKAIIFHDYRLAKTYLDKLGKQPKQKVLIMPHSPTDLTTELVENWRSYFGQSRIWTEVYQYLAKIELETLLATDGLVVPCQNALQHYFKTVSERQHLFQIPIYEILSGVPEVKPSQNRRGVLSCLGISYEAKIVGYFGRRHPHKGFDLFCQAAQIAYESKYYDLVFIAAGSGPLLSPRHLPNFLDLGYLTEELPNVLAAVDLVVVPNRVCYFDLFVLEAMSLGKPILTSRVGGNTCLNSPGIFYIETLNPEGLLSSITQLLSDPSLLEEAGRINRRVYEQLYNLAAFGKRHEELAKSILAGELS